MFNKYFLASFLALTPIVANADFMVEFDAGYSFGELTTDPDGSFKETDDYNRYHLGAVIYKDFVDTSDSPYQEAGFLSKKSSVSLDFDRESFDEEFFGKYVVRGQKLAGRFVLPGPNLILMASVIDNDRGYDTKNDTAGMGLGIGFYTGDRGALSFEHEKLDHEFVSYPDDTERTFRLSYKYVAGSGKRRVAFMVFGERNRYEDTFSDEENDRASVGGNVKFYINQRLSVRSEERRVGKECRSRWSPYH